MRQGQQNRRGRGRHNNPNNGSANPARKHQNPLTRSFESNGPDVKIRGTPAHIAEKYMALARDALGSGDPVLAENYLQHAEHYNRIIMAYREQQSQHQAENQSRHRSFDDQGGEEDDAQDPRFQARQRPEQQPRFNGHHNGNGTHYDAAVMPGGYQQSHQRRDEPAEREGQDALSDEAASAETDTPHQQRPRGRNRRLRDRGPRDQAPRELQVVGDETPEFLRRPIRRHRSEGEPDGAAAGEQPAPAGEVVSDGTDQPN
ncbi:MAG: DUF4167 domain-containing protein [Hyphomicrobiaceae bacterium]